MEEYRNSQEYIDAFAQYIKSGDDEEIRALLTENVSGTVPVPEFVYDVVKTAWTKDGIMNLVRKSYLKGNLKVGYEIASSGAVIHQEGGDPIDEEQLTLGIVHLVPRNIKKYIAISDELYDLSSRDFLTYVYSELTYQIAKKCGETLIERIVSLSTQSNVPVVDYIDSAITTSTVAMALSKLSDEAVNPVVVMNKGSWGFFKKEQYDNKFGVDVFEGLPVVFNNALKPYNEATTGETFAIVGDFGNGALANYPNGEEVLLKTDELTLAQQDLIKIIGRQYVAVDVVAPKHFAVVNKGDEVTPIVPTGNIEITENTPEGEPLNISQYATATVNVSGGGGSSSEVVYVSGTFTPEYSAEAQAYIVVIDTPTVIAQPMNNHFILTVGNVTKNVLAEEDTYQIPGGIYRLEPETPEERAELLGVMPLAIGSPTVIIAPSADPVFIELKQAVGTLDITITSDQTGSPLFYVESQENGTTWSRNTAVYQPDFETHITIPYCGVKRAYISITGSFTYQNAVNCRVENDLTSNVIIIYDNNASIDLTFVQ